eukprot:TRINITY_DN9121_c0_g3_i1.p1 TRINITY_DN9121_c0_g3~~TRINITY_DN9121_c0_g3_i1.p1  ORF type:complete len:322 (+),score=60.69 TRINITY_DN9121_c0_g3_i1:241-1206(+)
MWNRRFHSQLGLFDYAMTLSKLASAKNAFARCPNTPWRATTSPPRRAISRLTRQPKKKHRLVVPHDGLFQALLQDQRHPVRLLDAGQCRVEGLPTLKAAATYAWTPTTIITTKACQERVAELYPNTTVHLGRESDLVKVMHQPRLDPVIAQGPIPVHAALSTWRYGVVLCCQDPYNMGALVRSSLAFGVDAIALHPNAVNPFNHSAIKASAGCVFGTRFVDYKAMLAQAKGTSLQTFRAEAHLETATSSFLSTPAQLSHRDVKPFDGRRVLVLGHETKGIPLEWQGIGTSLHVATSGAVESLSVNAAGAIILDCLSVYGDP